MSVIDRFLFYSYAVVDRFLLYYCYVFLQEGLFYNETYTCIFFLLLSIWYDILCTMYTKSN